MIVTLTAIFWSVLINNSNYNNATVLAFTVPTTSTRTTTTVQNYESTIQSSNAGRRYYRSSRRTSPTAVISTNGPTNDAFRLRIFRHGLSSSSSSSSSLVLHDNKNPIEDGDDGSVNGSHFENPPSPEDKDAVVNNQKGQGSGDHEESQPHTIRQDALEAAESMVQIEISNEKKKDMLLLGDLMADVDLGQIVPEIPTNGSDESAADQLLAPPMAYQKYVTMNSKRVPVQIRYTNAVGLRPYFLTVAKRLNTDYPDVLVERLLLPRSDGVMSGGGGSSSTDADGVFEVLVDGRVVVRLNSGRRGVAGTDSGMTIFVSMEEVDQAIARARRRRRPSTVFDEGNETNVRLEVLKNKATESQNLKQKDNR